jgi:hypothetical protein
MAMKISLNLLDIKRLQKCYQFYLIKDFRIPNNDRCQIIQQN